MVTKPVYNSNLLITFGVDSSSILVAVLMEERVQSTCDQGVVRADFSCLTVIIEVFGVDGIGLYSWD